MDPPFDIIVFGGSGFTGEYVVREMIATYAKEKVKWCIAGRDKVKMQACLASISAELSEESLDVPVIVADVNDQESLEAMCKQCRCLINCVGPYYLWGRQVIQACINNKTHYLDISGEPLFMETMAKDFNDAAKEAGVVVASACGFDSIPVDIGVRYCQQQFQGTLTVLESYMNARIGNKGFSVHFPTFQCVVNGFSNSKKLVQFRKEQKLKKLPYMGPRLQPKTFIKFHPDLKRYYVPFAGSDRSVALRSQRHFNEHNNDSPVQVGVYMTFQSTGLLIYLTLFGIVFAILVMTRCGRYLLLNYPRMFTLGLVTKEGATREQIAQSSFSFTFYGAGYSNARVAGDEGNAKPDRFIEAEVTGPDPGYVSCSIFIAQAAYALLNKPDIQGGVVTPSVALEGTDYIQRLDDRGIHFRVKYQGDDLKFSPIC